MTTDSVLSPEMSLFGCVRVTVAVQLNDDGVAINSCHLGEDRLQDGIDRVAAPIAL